MDRSWYLNNPEREGPTKAHPDEAFRCPVCGRGGSHTVGLARPITTCFNGHTYAAQNR